MGAASALLVHRPARRGIIPVGMMVDHASVVRALKLHGGTVPRFPTVKVTLAKPDDTGLAEMTIEGSAHATEGDVAIALGLTGPPGTIKKTTSTTVGYVVSEPHRQPSPGAVASRGTIKRSQPAVRVVDKDVIEANVAGTESAASRAGRRKT